VEENLRRRQEEDAQYAGVSTGSTDSEAGSTDQDAGATARDAAQAAEESADVGAPTMPGGV
jgi:hypothetical protein